MTNNQNSTASNTKSKTNSDVLSQKLNALYFDDQLKEHAWQLNKTQKNDTVEVMIMSCYRSWPYFTDRYRFRANVTQRDGNGTKS
jgi:hypothetical protein